MKQDYGPAVVLLENDSQDALGWTGLGWTGLGWTGLGWTGLGWTGLDWAGLGWAGLGWVAARSAELHLVHAFRWPYLFDALGELTLEERDLEAAEAVADDGSCPVGKRGYGCSEGRRVVCGW